MNPKRLMILIAILALAAPTIAGRFPTSWAGAWTLNEEQMDCDGDCETGLKQVEVTDGGCEGGYCSMDQISGSRGAAPVESMTWSTVKTLYD